MRAGLRPEYEGYYGQLVLTGEDRAELAEPNNSERSDRPALFPPRSAASAQRSAKHR